MQLQKQEIQSSLAKVLLQKDMLIILTAAFLILMNVYNALTILPLYVLHQGGTEFAAGAVNTLFTLAAVILRFYLGPMADTRGRKFPLLIGSFVFFSAPLLIWLSPNLWIQGLTRIYHAVGMAAFLSTASSLVADLTPLKFRGTVLGIYRMILVLALMVGPPVGMRIVGGLGYPTFFWLSAVSSLLALLLLLFLSDPKPAVAPQSTGTLTNFKVLLKDRILFAAYLGVVVISVCYGILMTYLSVYAKSYAAIENPGTFFTFFAAGGALATLAGGYASDRFGRAAVIWPLIICLGIGVGLLVWLIEYPGLILLASGTLAGIGFSGAFSTLIAWIVDNAQQKLRATALALQENAIDGSIAFGAFVFGLGTVKFEFPWLFLILGLLTSASPLLLSRLSR